MKFRVPKAVGPHRELILARGINPMVKLSTNNKPWPGSNPATSNELNKLDKDIVQKVNSNVMHFLAYSYFDEKSG